MKLSRRQFGAFSFGLLASTALAGCAAGTVTTVALSAFEDDAKLILAGIEAFADVTVQPLVSDTDWSKIEAYESSASDVLTTIGGLASTVALTTGQTIIQQIETDANGAIGVLETYADLPADVTAKISAIETLLPIVLAAVSLSTVASARKGARLSLTPDQARAILAKPKG